jgi:hypothetical protein
LRFLASSFDQQSVAVSRSSLTKNPAHCTVSEMTRDNLANETRLPHVPASILVDLKGVILLRFEALTSAMIVSNASMVIFSGGHSPSRSLRTFVDLCAPVRLVQSYRMWAEL